MIGKLILLFVLVPLADLTLLLWLSSRLGWQLSIGLVIISGIVGASMAKRSYLQVFRRYQENPLKASFSLEFLSDGMMIFLAAGMLLTPGFLTDFFGLTLLIPACRRWYRARLGAWIQKNVQTEFKTTVFYDKPQENEDGVVDGEVQSRDGGRNSLGPPV